MLHLRYGIVCSVQGPLLKLIYSVSYCLSPLVDIYCCHTKHIPAMIVYLYTKAALFFHWQNINNTQYQLFS